MRRLRVGINVGVLLVPLLVLVGGGIVCVRGVYHYLNSGKRLAGVASAEASRILGRKVSIGDVRFSANLWSLSARNDLLLTDVAVAEAEPNIRSRFFSVDQVRVVYNLRQALLSADRGVPILNELSLVGPTLAVSRDATGGWNFSQLLKGSTQPSRPLVPRIGFSDGTVLYSDRHFPHSAIVPEKLFRTTVTDATGSIQLRPDHSFAFDVSALGPDEDVKFVQATGVFGRPNVSGVLTIHATGVNVPFVVERLLPEDRLKALRGSGVVDVTLLFPTTSPTWGSAADHNLGVQGKVELTGVDLRVAAIDAPIENVTGSATFTDGFVTTRATGRVAGAATEVQGTLLGLKRIFSSNPDDAAIRAHGAVSLSGSASNVDIPKIARAIHLDKRVVSLSSAERRTIDGVKGRGEIVFRVSGDVTNLSAVVAARFNTLKSGKVRGSNLALDAVLADRVIHADLRGVYGSGKVLARGGISTDRSSTFTVRAQARDLRIEQLPIETSKPVAGVASLDVFVSGRRGSTPSVTGQVQVSDVKYDKMSLDLAYAAVRTVGDTLNIDAARVEDAKGFALARGAVDLKSRKLNVRVEADELDLAAIADAVREPPGPMANPPMPPPPRIAGTAYVRGRLTGTLDDPTLNGRVSAYGLQAGNADIDSAEALLDVSRGDVVISEGMLRRYPGDVRIDGIITDPFKPDGDVNVTAAAENLDVADLIAEADVKTGALDVTGLLSGVLHVSGTVKAPVATSDRISLENATLNQLPLTDAVAGIAYEGGAVQIGKLTGKLAGGTISASGDLSKEGGLSLDVTANGLQLNALTSVMTQSDDVQLAGALSATAHVDGTTDKPTATFAAATTGLRVNEVDLGELTASGAYADDRVTGGKIALGASAPSADCDKITVSDLTYDTQTKAISGAAKIDDLSFQGLRELIENSGYARSDQGASLTDTLGRIAGPIRGSVSGTVVLSGTSDDPVAEVAWTARDIRVNDHLVSLLTGSARVTRTEALIPSPATPDAIAHLESPDAKIDARGVRVVYDGSIAGSVNAYNVNLSFLQNWLSQDIARQVTGTGDVFIDASGETKSPTLDVSVNLRNVGYNGQTLDRLDIDHATVKEGLLTAETVRALKEQMVDGKRVTYVANLHGSVGFSYSAPFIPEDAPIDFQADAPKQSLQIVSAFFPDLVADSAGEIGVSASVKGTRTKPNVTGTATLTASRLRVKAFDTGLRDVNAAFSFQGDRIAVDSFTAKSQVYDRKTGLPDPKLTGDPIALSGSLPLVKSEAHGGSIRLQAPRAPFFESPIPGSTTGVASGVADIDLRATGAVNDLTLRGAITASNGQVTLPRDFNGPPAGVAALPINPNLDLQVKLGDRMRLVNAELNARTTGNIDIKGTLASPQVLGQLTIAEGRLLLPTARFTVLPHGALTLRYPVVDPDALNQPSLGINIDLRAQTNLTARSYSGVTRSYRITVTAQGPITGAATDPLTGVSRLQLSFVSDPPDLAYDQQTLAQRVTGLIGGDVFTEGRFGDSLAAQFSNVFTNSVLPGVFDRPASALGFEELSLGYDPIEQLTFNASRHIFGPLYIHYQRSLTAITQFYEFKASIKLNDHYQISYTADDLHEDDFLLEGVFRF